jgi:hypothetical protein
MFYSKKNMDSKILSEKIKEIAKGDSEYTPDDFIRNRLSKRNQQ